jgi:hypothetical protein
MIAVALATFVAAPAFAQKAVDPAKVMVGGKFVGKDPDAGVRFELRRDWQIHAGGGSE